MLSDRTTLRASATRLYRRILPWALALAVATCSDDQVGPSHGGTGYFAFKPVYGISNSLSQFGVVADSVHILLTRPVNQVVLDTTVFFSPDSSSLHLALPIHLESSPESLSAVVEIKAGPTLLFVDSLNIQVFDGPPNATQIPTVTLAYVGPGKNVAAITLAPGDTTIVLGDTLFFSATAVDSSATPVTTFYVAWKTSDTAVAKVNAQGRLIAPMLRGNVKVIGYTPTGVADTTLVIFAPVPTAILADSGNGQTGIVSDSLGALFVAKVIGADNLGISGVQVRFAAPSTSARVRDTILTTDANGRVRTRGLLDTLSGSANYSATVVGTAITTTFTATATAAAPTIIAILSGNVQTDSAGRVLAPLVARVTDAFGNPVTGALVVWTRKAGTGTISIDTTATTAGGGASTIYTLGAVGSDTVTATLAGTSAFVDFTATAINGAPASVTKVFGDAQSDTVGRLLIDSLAVVIKSATTRPVVGAPVVWTVLRGGVSSPDTAFTDVNGRAAVAYTLGTVAEIDSIRAQAGNVSAIFTATAAAGQASLLAISSGNAQSDTAERVLPLPFVVHATDAFGNSVLGTKIVFQRITGTGTLAGDTVFTNAAGLASTGYTLGQPGLDSVKATLLCGCTSVFFSATAVPGLPAAILTLAGDSQTVVVGTISTDTIVVSVRDASNNPVVGVNVDWVVIPAVGSLTVLNPTGVQRTLSDSLGIARAVRGAGNTAQTVLVEVQAGAIKDTVKIFEVAAAASAIIIASGDAQSDTVGKVIPLPMVARVADAFNNPVAGSKVVFTRIAGSGTLSTDTVTTNASGLAAVGYLFGLVPMVDTIRATLVSTGGTVDFAETALPATPASIITQFGDGQSSIIAIPFTDSLVVQVLDGNDNPIVNGAVLWTMASGGTLADDTTFTDATGHTSIRVTAGTLAGTYTVQAQALGLGTIVSFNVTVVAGAPSGINIVSGNTQVDTTGRPVTQPFVVLVTDVSSNPVPNVKIFWTRTAGTGTVSADSTFTDGTGHTSISYLLGATPSIDTVIATIAGSATTATFNVTGVPAAPALLTATSGSGQSGIVGAVLALPLRARALDGGSNPIPGITLVWSVVRGGSLDVDTVVTDSLGYSQATYTLGSLAGTDSVKVATLGGGLTAFFTSTANAGAAATISLVSGNAQFDTVNVALPSPLVVKVTDGFGNPVTGAAVAWQRIAGSGTPAFDTVLTDGAGHAAVSYTLGNVPALDTIRASLVGTSGFVNFTATTVAAAPASIIAASGNAQSDTVGRLLPNPLVARVYNAGSVPIAGVTVVWSVVRGGSLSVDTTVTDSLGKVQTNYTLGTVVGIDTVKATTLVGGFSASFTASATSASATSIAIVAGNDQIDTTGRALATPLTTAVTDGFGNPVLGAKVLFAVRTGIGTLSADTVLTDAAGHAATTFTLGTFPAVDTVRANLLGTSAFVDFSETAVSGAAALVAKILGDNQVDTVLSTLTDSLIVELRDAGNTPIPNTWLYWQTAGATLSADSTRTGANGQAAVRVTFDSLAIPIVVLVRNIDTTLGSVFNLKATAGHPTQITVAGGDGQSGAINDTLPSDFIALVRDSYGNLAQGGVSVTWTSIRGFASTGLPDTTLTDTLGLATLIRPVLGTVVGADSLAAQVRGTGITTLFTATTNAGAASTLAYVSGTGQSDTVARALPAPFTVQVRDVGSNPVSGIWVRFKSISGGGTYGADSAQTDLSGVASTTQTLGTLAGLDSTLATIAGSIDTIRFYAVGTNDVPATIVTFAGDTQAGTVGGTLGAPMEARVLDQYGNPAIGVTVDFALLSGSGLTFATPSIATDGTGIARTGTVTLGGVAESYKVGATTASLPADTAFFTVTSLPIGATKQWTAAVSTDWQTGGNWAPAGVPTATDSVFIPNGVAGPVLSSSDSVGKLELASGATVSTATFTLTSKGSVSLPGAAQVVSTGGGALDLAGTGQYFGQATNLTVSGSYTIPNNSGVTTALNITPTGVLDLAGAGLDVGGTFTQGGRFVMKNPADTVIVGGTFAVTTASSGTGDLTQGAIELLGNFDQSGSAADGFQATATHLTWFKGGSAQTGAFTNGGFSGVTGRFGNVRFENTAGVSFSTTFGVAGTSVALAGVVTGPRAEIAGDISSNADSLWAVTVTSISQPATFPDTLHGSLELRTSQSMINPQTILGSLTILPGATLTSPFGYPLHVTGALSVQGALTQAAAIDSIEVDGDLNVNSSSTSTLSKGTLVIHGNFAQAGADSSFQAGPLHTTHFASSTGTLVTFATPDTLGNGLASHFGSAVFDQAGSLMSSASFQGNVTVLPGITVNGGGSSIAAINGDLLGSIYSDWTVTNTRFTGLPIALPDSFKFNVELTKAGILLAKPLAVGGTLTLSGSSVLRLGGQWVRVGADLVTTDSGSVVMLDPTDSLDISGLASFGGAPGAMNEGVTVFRGNFSAPSLGTSFATNANHRSRFAGTATQAISMSAPGFSADRFSIVEFDNPSGASLSTAVAMIGNVTIKAGTVAGAGVATLGAGLIDTTNTAWQVYTIFANAPSVLPLAVGRGVEFLGGSTTLTHNFTVHGPFQIDGATTFFAPGGFTLTVDSTFSVTDTANFSMTNSSDLVTVGGNILWAGFVGTGNLTAGTLAAQGWFSTNGVLGAFQPSGTHLTVLQGTAVQRIALDGSSPSGNRFNRLQFGDGIQMELVNPVYVGEQLQVGATTPAVVSSFAGLQSLTVANNLSLDGVVFDSVTLAYSGAAPSRFNDVTFQRQDPAGTPLSLVLPGGNTVLDSVQFLTLPSTGKYIAAADSASDASPVVLQFFNSSPLDGSAYELEIPGADGTTIDWSSMAFAAQPLNAGVGALLAPVQVEIRDPSGSVLTTFTGPLSVSLFTNPSGATLGGPTTVNAVAGVATFDSLTVDSAGLGYTLSATSPGFVNIGSNPFNITVPVPVGFTASWLGGTSADWSTASNWSTGVVPDSSTNVFISNFTPNAPQLASGTVAVNRLRLAPSATLTLQSGTTLTADSSVEAGTALVGPGTLNFKGSGTISGAITAQANVLGTYAVTGSTSFGFNLSVSGDLAVTGADTLSVQGLLMTTGGTGRLIMTSPQAVVDVNGPAQFDGGSTSGQLVDGVLRISGGLATGGPNADAFAPSPTHTTVLNGSGVQTVQFATPDSAVGSHFGKLQVATSGTAFFLGHYDALGDVIITTGATLADSIRSGFTSHGFTSIDAGGTMAVSTLHMEGALGVAVGSTYSVATTRYFGGAAVPINPAPYDTLLIETPGSATADFAIQSDLRVNGNGASPASFNVNGHTILVNGGMRLDGTAGTIVMQDPAGALTVVGDFFDNGGNTEGLLTAGLLQIGGNFRQAGDGSSAAFRASAGHTTRFTGLGTHSIKFDNPVFSPTDSTNSRFGDLDLPSGLDSLLGNGALAENVSIGGALVDDTTFGSRLQVLGPLTVLAGAPMLQVQDLNLWNGITFAGDSFKVVNTTFLGGSTLPSLTYRNVSISNPTLTMNSDVTATGSFGIGQNGEVGGSNGELIVNGHTLKIGGSFATGGYGVITMASGDSVDAGDVTFNGGKTAGHLLGGVLVNRGNFSASNHSGDSTFIAAKGFRTVFADTSALGATVYLNTFTESGMQFGKLLILDAAPRHISSFGSRMIVQDSLILGASGAGFGAPAGYVLAKGPVFGVTGSALTLAGLEVDSTLITSGGYAVVSTTFGGTGQLVPALPYQNVTVWGTATLTDSLIIGSNSLTIGGAGVPADLNMAGHLVRAASFLTTEQGTVTMTNPADTLDVLASTSFAGGNETGKISAGVLRLHGTFTQDSTNSPASFYANGTHETRFTDSAATVVVTTSSMTGGASRFNDVAITGNGVGTGIAFTTPVWIGGNAGILSPTIDSVAGTFVTIAGSLNDPTQLWRADTTALTGTSVFFPDTMRKDLWIKGPNILSASHMVYGEVKALASVALNGHTLHVGHNLSTEGTGRLLMGNAVDSMVVDSTAIFNGATEVGFLTNGRLILNGQGLTRLGAPDAFDAGQNHITQLSGSSGQTLTFTGGPQGYGFNHLEVYNPSIAIDKGVLVHGTFTDSVKGGTLFLNGADSALVAGRVVLVNAQLAGVTLVAGDSSVIDTVSFSLSDPEGKTALTIRGAGRTTPLDLRADKFTTLPTAGLLLQVDDTLADANGLTVRMFGSTPFDGSTLTALTGGATAAWSHLVLTSLLPATIDSAVVGLGLSVGVLEPDTTFRAVVNGTVDVSIASGPVGEVLNGTTSASFDGQNANFFALSLLVPGTVSFHLEMQGRAIDSFTTATLDVINPAPAGAIVFDGGAADGLWSSPLNWSTDVSPTPADSVFIPAGVTVTFDKITDTIGTLVLGSSATLNLLPGDTLVTTGRVAAGNTIAGSGVLTLAGTGLFSGSLPTVRITGQRTAIGTATINGDLTVFGPGAELNVGGAKVSVNGSFTTDSGGVLTMDGASDSLIAGNYLFQGGSTVGRLTAGTMVMNGTTFQQFGPVRAAFAPSGGFTTVIQDAGAPATVTFMGADSSFFNHLVALTPNGVTLSGDSGTARVQGDLTLSNNASLTGYIVAVGGHVDVQPGTTITPTFLKMYGTISNAGTYAVNVTDFAGVGQTIPDLPYLNVQVTGPNATLGTNVVANQFDVSKAGFNVNGHTLHVSFLTTADSGVLVMQGAADSVIADSAATFGGALESGSLTAGTLILHGNFNSVFAQFQASGDHTTIFAGPNPHQATLSIMVVCGGPCPIPSGPTNTQFNHLVVDTTTLLLVDPARAGSQSLGNTTLHSGIISAGAGIPFNVGGDLIADATSQFTVSLLGIGHSLLLDPGAIYAVGTTDYNGPNGHVKAAPYQQLYVSGTAVLDTAVTAFNSAVYSTGSLALGGHTLSVDSNFTANDSAHLVMANALDSLMVGDTATFSSDSTEGDFTAGGIHARVFRQTIGLSGSNLGFVQTGTNRLVPQAGDTIVMIPTGPLGSRLQSMDFGSASGTVVLNGLWIADSMSLSNPATIVDATLGGLFVVQGAVVQTAGQIVGPRLAVGGTMAYTAGAYSVDLTVFSGSGQIIDPSVPYRNIEVQYDASLGGSLDLFTGGYSAVVDNSGVLDLAGHSLLAGLFHTESGGRLKMASAADTLRVTSIQFNGGSTAGLLTAGLIQTGNFSQTDGNSLLSFAPSGSQKVEIVNIGFPPEVGYSLSLAPTAADTASHFNRLSFLATAGSRMLSNFYAADSLYINNTLNGGSHTVVGAGPITIGTAAAVTLDTLRVLGTLSVDPSATYTVANTVFGPAAAPMPALTSYSSVYIEGTQTLTAPITVGGDLYVRGNGALTPNANKVSGTNGLWIQDNAHLVMASGADTVDMGNAHFDGPPTATDLSAGILRLRNGLFESNVVSSQSFAPTGTTVEFYGGGTASVNIQVPSPFNSYIRDLRVIGRTTIALAAGSSFLVLGPAVFQDGSTFDGTLGTGAIEFRKKVFVLDTSKVNSANMFLSDSLFVNIPTNYNVANTNFYNTNGIPDLPYQFLVLGDNVHDTLTHPLTVTNQLILSAGAADSMDLVLNGNTVTTGFLSVGGYGRFTMNNPIDSMVVTGSAIIGGADLSGRLTAGLLSIGQDFSQVNGFVGTTTTFRADGTATEFVPGPSHNITFASPGASYFGSVSSQGIGTLGLTLATDMTANGTVGGYGVNIIGLPGTKLTADTIAFGPASGVIFVPTVRTQQVTGVASIWNAATTEIIGNGIIPVLAYDTLSILGNDTLALATTTANWVNVAGRAYVPSGATLHSTKDLVVDGVGASLRLAGGFVNVDSTFSTFTSGVLQNDSGGVNTHHAVFNGGAETGLLTGGALNVTGDFIQAGAAYSFDADSTFTVAVNGGGQHNFNIANPATTKFGTLLLEGSSFGTDTTTFPSATTLNIYRLSTNNSPTIIGSNSEFDVQTLGVNGLANSGVRIKQESSGNQPLMFDNVTFSGFAASDIQLNISHPGDPAFFAFNNIDFDNVADGTTGFGLQATDNAADANTLQINLNNSADNNIAALINALGGAIILWVIT